MFEGDSPDHAFTQQYTVVLDQFVHGLGKGNIRSKIAHRSFQGQGTAPVGDMGTMGKGAYSLIPLT